MSNQHSDPNLSEDVPQTEEDSVCADPDTVQDTLSIEDMYERLLEQYTELQNKHAEVSDAYLRAKAEAENIRRRGIEEEAKARKFAIESFAKELLPVKDSLEAAINESNQTFETLKEGVQTTLKQLNAAFERNKLAEIAPAVGDKLDPNIHQAIAVVPSEGQEANTIVNILQKGYTIADRTLRPAIVTVAAKKE